MDAGKHPEANVTVRHWLGKGNTERAAPPSCSISIWFGLYPRSISMSTSPDVTFRTCKRAVRYSLKKRRVDEIRDEQSKHHAPTIFGDCISYLLLICGSKRNCCDGYGRDFHRAGYVENGFRTSGGGYAANGTYQYQGRW